MSSWSRVNAGFIVNEDDSGDKFIFNGGNNDDTAEHFLKFQDGTGDADPQPKFLTAAADGSGDYSKENCYATDSGWVMRPGSASQGNDNPDADPEILVCSRGLKSNGTGDPTANQITIGHLTSKTAYYPDGGTFTGVASSTLGDIVVYLYFNEPVTVIGTPTIELKDASDLTGTFAYGGTNLTYRSSVSNLDAGIVAFQLAASVDTQTSAVDDNTLGIPSGASWVSSTVGQITKRSGGVIRDESDNVLVFDDGASTEAPMSFGEIVLEDGDNAELLIRASENASMTVS